MDRDRDNHRYPPSHHRQGYGSYGSSGGNNGGPGGWHQDRDEGNGDNGGVNYGGYRGAGGNSGSNAGGGRGSFSRSSNYSNYSQYHDNGQQASSNNGRYGNNHNEYNNDGGQQERPQTRDSGGDSYSNYSARLPQQRSPPESARSGNPSEGPKTYQQAKSSDQHVQHASTKHAVTVSRTSRDMATQTTDDNMLTHESIWNGIRVVGIDMQPAQSQPQRAATKNIFSTMPVLRPAVPPSAAVATSLLRAVTSPPAPSVTSPTASAPLSVASTGRPSYEREGPSGWGETNAGSHSQSYMGSNPGEQSSRQEPSESWAPESSSAMNMAHSDRKDSVPVDMWSVGATAAVPATGGGWGGGWGTMTSAKGVGAMVDWSSGAVSEFPTDAKPTAMSITAPWNVRDPFAASDKAPANDQQHIADDHRGIEDEKDGQTRSTWGSRGNQIPFSNQGGENHNSSSSSSQIAFEGRRPSDTPSNSSSHDGDNRGRPQQRNPYPQMLSTPPTPSIVRSHLSNYGSERRPMTSEERFVNSQNRQNSTQNDYDTGAAVGTPSYDTRSSTNNDAGNSYYNNNSGGNNNANHAFNSYYDNNSGGSNNYNSSFNNRGSSTSRGGGSQQGSENNSYRGGSFGGRGGPASHRWNSNSERTGPTSVLPSSPSNLTGRRYYSNNPNRESAISAWSAASQNSSRLAGNSGRPARSSSTAGSTEAHYSPTARTGVSPNTAHGTISGGSGLATANDFLSFMKAAKEFTPPLPSPGRNQGGGSIGAGRESRNGSVSGSVRSSKHSSPSGSRQHSRTRQNTYEQDQDREHEHGPQHDHTHRQPLHMDRVPESEREIARDIGDQHFLVNESQTKADWSEQVEEEEAELEKAQTEIQQSRPEAPLIPGLEGSERSIRSPPDSVTSNHSNGSQVVTSAVEGNLLSFESHEVNDDTATESKDAAAVKEVEEDDGESGGNNQTESTAESEVQEPQHAANEEYESHPTPSTTEQKEPQNSANVHV